MTTPSDFGHQPTFTGWRRTSAYLLLTLMVISFSAQGLVAKRLETEQHFHKPYLIVWTNHCFLALILPFLLLWMRWRRPAYGTEGDGIRVGVGFGVNCDRGEEESASTPLLVNTDIGPPRASSSSNNHGGFNVVENNSNDQKYNNNNDNIISWSLGGYMRSHNVTWKWYFVTGAWVALLYLAPNYLFFIGLAAPDVSATIAAAVFNSNCAFATLFAACLLRRRPGVVRLFAVTLALGAVAMIALQDSTAGPGGDNLRLSTSVLIVVVAAAGIGLYEVAYKRWAVCDGRLPLPLVVMLMAQNGISHAFLFWWPLPLLNAIGYEPWSVPTSEQLILLLINATLALLGNIGLMVALALCPDPVTVAVATLIVLPVTAVAEFAIFAVDFKPLALGGGGLVIVAFAILLWQDYRDENMKKEEEEEEEEKEGEE